MYEDISFEKIMERMLKKVPDNIDKREGSIIYDAISASALELCNLYIELDNVLNEGFYDTASREYLIRHASERGISPFKATKAVLRGEFNIDVPIFSRFSLDDLNYVVTEKISDKVYKVTCETEGTVGNKRLGSLIPIEYIEGLETALLTEVLIPAEDEEDTESFRKRYIDSITNLSFGGNQADYKEKVMGIPGVGNVLINPAYYGGGTVRIVISDSEFNPPGDMLVSKVQEILDPLSNQGEGVGLAPIGHKVTVEGAIPRSIDIAFNLSCEEGISFNDIKDSINEAIDGYFKELSKNWPDSKAIVVRVSGIEMRILNLEGVIDIASTRINGETGNLILNADELPVRGSVNG